MRDQMLIIELEPFVEPLGADLSAKKPVSSAPLQQLHHCERAPARTFWQRQMPPACDSFWLECPASLAVTSRLGTEGFDVDSENRRAGLLKVADLAGVSLSTVDRVLNERGSVSDHKRRKVLNAARALGLKRLLPSPVHGLLRFDLLMVESSADHFRRLTRAFTLQGQMMRSRLMLQTQTWDEHNPEQLLDFIARPRTARQGLIVVAHDTPTIRAALQAQISQGVPVVLLTSSLSGLDGATFIGIDNRVAGRSAGRLLSQWVGANAGHVLLLTNCLLYHAHQQRVGEFLDVLYQRAAGLLVTDRRRTDPRRTQRGRDRTWPLGRNRH